MPQASLSLPLKQRIRLVASEYEGPAIDDARGDIAPEVTAATVAVSTAMQSYRKVDLQQVHPIPVPKGWMMDEETLAFLIRVIEALGPTHIIEFGSGISTQVIAWACARLRHRCHITSIDHDPEFIERTREQIEAYDPSAPVTYLFAPLVARKLSDRLLPTYHFSRDAVSVHGFADLIVVDGPPRALGGREGVLYQALDMARVGTLILLHDADRQEEKDAILNWQKVLKGAIQITSLPEFPKGLAAIVVAEPISMDEVPLYRIRQTIQELQGFVDPGTTPIVIDDGTWPPEAFDELSAKHFLERNGTYWGRPGSDEQAIEELERLHGSGARYLTFIADSFWWLQYYAGFQRYVESRFKCVLRNERLIVFDMQKNGAS
jgi:predicted O-methyltransferase YrrM